MELFSILAVVLWLGNNSFFVIDNENHVEVDSNEGTISHLRIYSPFVKNYANERLQQHFNRHLFKLEQEEYLDDGIDTPNMIEKGPRHPNTNTLWAMST